MSLFERKAIRTEKVKMKGMSGKQIALFVGGGFVAALIIFYLIGNWDYVGNSFLCFAQNVAGMTSHYHFPMANAGETYPCTASGANNVNGNNGDFQQSGDQT